MIENQKKNMEIIFLHNSPSNTWFRNIVDSLLSRADVRGSGALTSFTVCDTYRHFVCQASTWKIGHTENI